MSDSPTTTTSTTPTMGPPAAAVAPSSSSCSSPMPPLPSPPPLPPLYNSNKRPSSPGLSVQEQELYLDDLGWSSMGDGAKKVDARPSPVWDPDPSGTVCVDLGALPATAAEPLPLQNVKRSTTTTAMTAGPEDEAFAKDDDRLNDKDDGEPPANTIEAVLSAPPHPLQIPAFRRFPLAPPQYQAAVTTTAAEKDLPGPPVFVANATNLLSEVAPAPAALEHVAAATLPKEEVLELKPLELKPLPAGGRKRGPKAHSTPSGRWTKEEDEQLRLAIAKLGPANWKHIAEEFLGNQRTDVQCLHRWQKVLQPGLVKGPWTKEEDDVIVECMNQGITKWAEIAERVPGRIGKQCRERWFNHLNPDLKKGGWTTEEDAIMIKAQAQWGNAWTKIANLLPGRSENTVKNRWNSATRRQRSKSSKAPGNMLYGGKEEGTEMNGSPLDAAVRLALQPATTAVGRRGNEEEKDTHQQARGQSKKKGGAQAQAPNPEQESQSGSKRTTSAATYDMDAACWDDLSGLDNEFHVSYDLLGQGQPQQPPKPHEDHLQALPTSCMPPPPSRQQQQQQMYATSVAGYLQQFHAASQAQQYQASAALACPSYAQLCQPSNPPQRMQMQVHSLRKATPATSACLYPNQHHHHQQQQRQYPPTSEYQNGRSSSSSSSSSSSTGGLMASFSTQAQPYHQQAHQPAPRQPIRPPSSSSCDILQRQQQQQQQRPMSSGRRFSPSSFLDLQAASHPPMPTGLSGLSPSFASYSFQPSHLHQPEHQHHRQYYSSFPFRPGSSSTAYQRGASPPAVPPASSHPQLVYGAEDHFLRSPPGHKDSGVGEIIGTMLTEGYQQEELHAVDHFLA